MIIIPFTKMEGTGNDFIMVDNRRGLLANVKISHIVKSVCHRRFGVGADGMIVLEKDAKTAFYMRYINSDGQEAAMCGNGARCIAQFAYRLGLVDKKFKFQTRSGAHEAEIIDDVVRLKLEAARIVKVNIEVIAANTKFTGDLIDAGIPHFVVDHPDIDAVNFKQLAREIRNADEFKPLGTNVNFVQVAKDQVKIRTYERGIENETLSCGTGVICATLSVSTRHDFASPIRFQTRGGELKVYFKREGEDPKSYKFLDIYLEGQVKFICDGIYYYEDQTS